MDQEKMVLTAAYFIAAVSLIAGASLVLPATAAAADGDIIISREVQPRAAIRLELAPDPNPQVVNPKPNAIIDSGLRGNRLVGELDDSEFAAGTSGTRLSQQLISNQIPRAQQPSSDAGRHVGVSGQNPVGHSGSGALGNVNGQINRSVQQGLRPLQILQR